MKVFKVWVDKCDYDTYDAFVCVANSEKEQGRLQAHSAVITYSAQNNIGLG